MLGAGAPCAMGRAVCGEATAGSSWMATAVAAWAAATSMLIMHTVKCRAAAGVGGGSDSPGQ